MLEQCVSQSTRCLSALEKALISENDLEQPLNQQETTHFMNYTHNLHTVGSSETLRNESDFDFAWLAGLLDADGGFYTSRDQDVSCEITVHEKEHQTLAFLKRHLGGSITPRVKTKAFRWRLHKRHSLERLVHNLNGRFQTQRLHTQFKKVCKMYDIPPKQSGELTLQTAWLVGFFCGDGSFSINPRAGFQPSAQIAQKEKPVLDKIQTLLGGNVYYDSSWDGWIWWVDIRSVPTFLDYLERFPLRNAAKGARLKGIRRFVGYLERGLHKDPLSQARLLHFVRLFQQV